MNPSASSHRSLKAYKNIAGLFTPKSINIAIGFVMVPLTLSYIDRRSETKIDTN